MPGLQSPLPSPLRLVRVSAKANAHTLGSLLSTVRKVIRFNSTDILLPCRTLPVTTDAYITPLDDLTNSLSSLNFLASVLETDHNRSATNYLDIHPALVLRPRCVLEKAGVKKGVHKIYSYQKKMGQRRRTQSAKRC